MRPVGLDLTDTRPATIGPALLERVARYRGHRSADDDVTLVVIHHNASHAPVDAGPKSRRLRQGLRAQVGLRHAAIRVSALRTRP